MAGITINETVVNKYNEMKFGKGGMKYFTCKLSDDLSEVVVDKEGSATSTWEEMEAQLPRNECRYVFFRFHYEHEGGKR